MLSAADPIGMLNRRRFIAGGASCLCCALTGAKKASAAAAFFDGCFISPQGFQLWNQSRPPMSSAIDGLWQRNRHFRTTGNAAIDRDLDRALSVVSDLLGVNPAFGFYDPGQFRSSDQPESMIMNAWASPEKTDIAGTWGTIGFGWDLFLKEFYGFDDSGTTIIAIVAHEFAHIWQQRDGHIAYLNQGYPRRSEINADFMAGYFLGSRKRANPQLHFKKAGELFLRLGSLAEGNPRRTHGNSAERIDAAEAGFRVAYIERKDVAGAFAAGLEFVRAR
jgi:hypothetical protein